MSWQVGFVPLTLEATVVHSLSAGSLPEQRRGFFSAQAQMWARPRQSVRSRGLWGREAGGRGVTGGQWAPWRIPGGESGENNYKFTFRYPLYL